MRCNSQGVGIIKKYERLKLQPYLCPAGIPTVGYGSTKAGKLGRAITVEEAEKFLIEDIETIEKQMTPLIRVEVTENEWSSLVSLVFNIGAGNFKISTLLRHLNLKEKEQAASQFSRWVFCQGKILKGLQDRRQAEKELFLKIS